MADLIKPSEIAFGDDWKAEEIALLIYATSCMTMADGQLGDGEVQAVREILDNISSKYPKAIMDLAAFYFASNEVSELLDEARPEKRTKIFEIATYLAELSDVSNDERIVLFRLRKRLDVTPGSTDYSHYPKKEDLQSKLATTA